jgi:hypothetical protein
MKPTIMKIEGMQDYDLCGLGFPLYIENKLLGKIGMTIQASKVEQKILNDSVFSLDGYRKINSFEFYEQNIENIDFEAFGLGDEFKEFKDDIDSLSSGMIEGVSGAVDSLLKDVNTEGIMDEINNWLGPSKDNDDTK